MAFDPYETGDGSPVEIMEFTNGAAVYYIANTVRDVVIAGRTYIATPYELTPFAQSKDSDDNNRTMKTTNQFPVIGLYQGAPTSSSTYVFIKRYHNDDPGVEVQSIWAGKIVAVNHIDDGEVEILLQPITSGAESTPPDTFSALCNAFLFQTPGCTLQRDDWRYVASVNSITNFGLNIQITGLRDRAVTLDSALAAPLGPLSSGELDIYWQGGYLLTGAGELRDIVEGNVGADPNTVRVNVPFRNLLAGDAITVFAGCDLSRATCAKKFNNVINFQGFPDIPEIDPANTELPTGTRTSTNNFAGPG